MRNFIYARNAADAANTIIAIPFDSIRSIHLTDATTLKIQYVGDDAGLGSAIFTITEGKSLEVIKAIVNSQRSSSMSFVSIIWTVASDAQATIIEVPSGALLGSVLAQNGTGTTIVQSDGTDTKITVNDNIEPGCRLEFVSDGTNWIVSGTVMSADAAPAFS